jgi:hypothetical protein
VEKKETKIVPNIVPKKEEIEDLNLIEVKGGK